MVGSRGRVVESRSRRWWDQGVQGGGSQGVRGSRVGVGGNQGVGVVGSMGGVVGSRGGGVKGWGDQWGDGGQGVE